MLNSYGSVPSRDVENDETVDGIRDIEIDSKAGRTFVVGRALSVLAIGLLAAILIAAFDSAGYDVNGVLTNFALIHAQPKPASKPLKVVKSTFYKDPTVKYVSLEEIYIEATNEYGHFDAPYSWMNDVEGSQLVEPYKDTTLTLKGSMVDSGDYTFVWALSDYPGELEQGPSAQSIQVKSTGTRQLTVQAIDASGIVTGTFTTVLIAKYVKREIRSLTDDDRDRFLDAAAAIWQYSNEEGKAKFGDDFTSISTFVAAHSLASNDIMCDTFHEGSGFISHHLALGNSFEAAMRAVDPAAVLPYWDFTIEGQHIHQVWGDPSMLLEISPVFSDAWFGSVDEDHHIADSRWAHAPMPKQEDAGSGVQNSYGYIRSYWNNNPDSEVGRALFSTCGVEPKQKFIPTCLSHYDILNASTLGDFQVLSPGDGHGPMHVQIGGMWGGCTEAYQNFSAKWGDLLDTDMTDEEIQAVGYKKWKWGNTAPRRAMVETAIMGEYFHIYRSLWRSHMCAADGSFSLLECPESCEEGTPFEECSCQVTKLVTGETTWENILGCVISTDNQGYFSSTMPEEMIKDLVYMVSTSSVMEGEMVESASTADIFFWIIHPVIERLLAAKRLPDVTSMGPFSFYKWPTVDGSDEEWLHYSYYDFDEGDNPVYTDAYSCTGHAATDPVLPTSYDLPYTDGLKDIVDADGDGVVTNWEFLMAINPNNVDGLDYVFDNFNWDHCDKM